MKKIIILCFLQALIYGCDNKGFLIENNNKKLKEYKIDFEDTLVDQFPNKIPYSNVNVVSNTNVKKNDIGLLLYEYEVDGGDIKNIRKKFGKRAIAKYKSSDSCFLVVNRFETDETYEKFEVVEAIDSTEVNKECAKQLYPIPNFIGSTYSKGKNDIKLDDSFEIYVLESKAGNHFKKFDVQPSPQMPDQWKNGYSKGIALSEKNKTIIYWSIIW
ncbi:MAG: hypothetical protein ABI549_08640 [Flavobacterium sp.]|uniref:hypothetical protein n=1 Tax=Flavobacterium sp. TaxID=239 RepID=UPI003267CE49